MNEHYETRFEAPGSLPSPGWIGRAARLLLGFGLLDVAVSLGRDAFGGALDWSRPPTSIGFWVVAAVLFQILPHVVNIGFGVEWGRRPQAVLAGAVAVVMLGGLVWQSSPWSEPLGWLLLAWILYESVHLGLSFVLAAILATPGCEMRSIPQLLAKLSGGEAREHYCPGYLDTLDRWESGLWQGS